MTSVLTIRTDHEDMAAAVRAIAPEVSETTVRISAERAIEPGTWVRFRWLLRDETVFWEGVGRAESCRPAGGRYALVLGSLSFDAKNEAIFERIQLGAEEGRVTGEPPAPMAPKPRYSSLPPPPRRALPAAPPPTKLASVVRSALRPKPSVPPPAPRQRPITPVSVKASGELVERARTLSRKLNLAAPSLARGRWTEQRVLDVALRMGIDALEGLAASRDADD